ncbi:SNARE protein [Lithospermum erythrorhizon]|uniref:SNARE protein n=1 Tax=Lithospermum erythrorhizon TaxID=34254 RepID=A0AAV3PK09_LITER
MFGFRKSASPAPAYNSKAKTPETGKQTPNPARRTSSEPDLLTPKKKSNYFDDDDDDDWGRPTSSSRTRNSAGPQDFDSMSTQELEGYAVNRAEDTTNSVNNCLKIAEDIRGDASRTLETLHTQGEQIHRTHEMAVDMEKDLKKVPSVSLHFTTEGNTST